MLKGFRKQNFLKFIFLIVRSIAKYVGLSPVGPNIVLWVQRIKSLWVQFILFMLLIRNFFCGVSWSHQLQRGSAPAYISHEYETPAVEILQNLLQFRFTEEDQRMLISGVSEEEIRAVVFNMPSNKSPGRDGYTTKHFKFARSIVGNDVVKAIQSFFLKGFLPKGINSAILALIPKKERATEMKYYRPISCCNVLYKVISKVGSKLSEGYYAKV